VTNNVVKVYAFCNSGNGTDMQTWLAMAETGEVITSHFSLSRYFGVMDVSPQCKWEAYEECLGEGFEVDYIVVDAGQAPPAEVVAANSLLRERSQVIS